MRGRRGRQEANFANGNPTNFNSVGIKATTTSNGRLQKFFIVACAAPQMPIRDEKADSRWSETIRRNGGLVRDARHTSRESPFAPCFGTSPGNPLPARSDQRDDDAREFRFGFLGPITAAPVIPRMPAHRTRPRIRRVTLLRLLALEPLCSQFRQNPGWRLAPSSPPTRRAR